MILGDMVLYFCWTVLHTSHPGWNKAQDSMARITSGRSRSRSGDLLRLQMDEGERMDGWRLQGAFELLFKVVENQLHMPMGQTPQCRPFTMPSLYLCVRTATKLESRPTSLRTNGVKENVPANGSFRRCGPSSRGSCRRCGPSTRGSFRRCGPSSRFGKYFHRLQCRAKPPQQKNNSGRHSSWCSKIAPYHPFFRLLLQEGPNYVHVGAPYAAGPRTEFPDVQGA